MANRSHRKQPLALTTRVTESRHNRAVWIGIAQTLLSQATHDKQTARIRDTNFVSPQPLLTPRYVARIALVTDTIVNAL